MLKFVFCLSLLLSTAAYAEDFPQTAPAPDATPAAETNMIVVTATQTLKLIAQVHASVHDLGQAATERARENVVCDLLLRYNRHTDSAGRLGKGGEDTGGEK